MADGVWLGVLARMGATAFVVVAACMLVERSGPLLGAMIATLPISAGPAYVFLAIEHGPEFVAASAPGSLIALCATAVFVTIYAHLAPRHSRAVSLAAAFAGWVVAAAIGEQVASGFAAILVLDAIIFAACMALTRRARRELPVVRARGRRWDIPIRAACAMALVGAVLLIGRALGPYAAGMAALAPVVLGSLGLLLYPRIGGGGAARVLATTLPGLIGNAVAVATLHRSATALGSAASLSLALLMCVAWNAALLVLGRPRAATGSGVGLASRPRRF